MMYFLAFYFTFGYYAVWGQVILISVLHQLLSEAVLWKTSAFLLLLGSPFYLFAWMMQARMVLESGGKTWPALTGLLVGNILGVTGITLWASQGNLDMVETVKTGFILLSLANAVIVALMWMVKRKRPVLPKADRFVLAGGVILFSLLQCAILVIFSFHELAVLAFMVVFFCGGAFLPVYVRYGARLNAFKHPETRYDLDTLCREFDLSPREKEVIQEICNGLTNQQIADRLFISLQTVKDHTSRIYYKTNCSSRTRLITMVRSSKEQ
jgi:DNA-binding CsgD family transcriptional regulator